MRYILLLLMLASAAQAEELKYRPINPAFGGNPFNGPYLLNNATAQREYEAPERERDSIEEFKDSIQSSILGRVSREITDQIMSEDSADHGSFVVGDLFIDYQKHGSEVEITLQDGVQGGSTTLRVPVSEDGFSF